jgi:ER membrane protein complex subunit 4
MLQPKLITIFLKLKQEVDDASITMSAEMQLAAKQRQVQAISLAPGKALLSTCFMLWMSGSSIQIFSIMMTGMALMNPLKGIAALNETFQRFEKEEGLSLYIPKLTYLALQVLALAVAVYKCSTMGLLPLTSSDWVSYLPVKPYLEQAGIPV